MPGGQPERILVDAKFIDCVRRMLITLATSENTHSPRKALEHAEPSRQYCEGYLGIDRDHLRGCDPQLVEDVLDSCGHPKPA